MATHAIISRNHKIAIQECESFIDRNQNNIKNIEEFPYLKVVTKDGDIYYFLDGVEYGEWKLGRTYFIDEKEYHSGYPKELLSSGGLLQPPKQTKPIYGDLPQDLCHNCRSINNNSVEEQTKIDIENTKKMIKENKLWKL